MSGAHFACTALVGTNKTGKLPVDENGYYTVVLGAFDFYNSANEYYPFASAKELFKESSSFMRRVRTGNARGEYGHPKPLPGMNDRQYIDRILEIKESQICCHFKEIWIDNKTIRGANGNYIIAVMGKVRPCGPYGPALKASLDNTDENVCFSVRCLTENQLIAGVRNKHMRVLVTYDFVNEPGISIANKYQAPSLEAYDETAFLPTTISEAMIAASVSSVSVESGALMRKDLENFSWAPKKPLKSLLW